MKQQSEFEVLGGLEKVKKVRKDKRRHNTPVVWDDDEQPTGRAAGKRGHSRHIEDYGFDDEDELEAYRHLLK